MLVNLVSNWKREFPHHSPAHTDSMCTTRTRVTCSLLSIRPYQQPHGCGLHFCLPCATPSSLFQDFSELKYHGGNTAVGALGVTQQWLHSLWHLPTKVPAPNQECHLTSGPPAGHVDTGTLTPKSSQTGWDSTHLRTPPT